MYNGQDYFTNRKVVQAMRKNLSENMMSKKEVLALGISASQLSRWEKLKKINPIKWKNSKYYRTDLIKDLAIQDME